MEHKIGTRDEWLSARNELLEHEKELTRRAIPRILTSEGEALYGPTAQPFAAAGTLVGTKVSPGVYEGVVRVLHVVDEQRELSFWADDLHLDRLVLQAFGVSGYDEQRGLEPAGLGILGPRHDEHRACFVDAGDVDLATLQHPARLGP